MRIRLIALPKRGELDEFDLRRLRVGETYELPPQLTSILLIGGYAELATPVPASQAPAGSTQSKPKF